MKSTVRFALGLLLFALLISSTQGAFTSLYVFGDGTCTTTNGPGGMLYYGGNYSNGRVWIEVLAQWQGLTYESNKNWSYFGHYSSNLLTHVTGTNFVAPGDIATTLVVVWVCNADFVFDMNNYEPFTTNNISAWTNAIYRSLTNHAAAITNLYNKGVRTLIMPNAVDITQIPQFNGETAPEKSFVRQRVLEFNAAFAAVQSNATATLPGLVIYSPDILTLADDVVAHAANYGLTNAQYNGHNAGVIGDPSMSPYLLNGPGTNYVFWDYWHPTAKFHMVIADTVQRMISPVQFSGIAAVAGSNRLDAINVPVGRAGFLDATTNFVNWASVQNVNTNFATQSLYVPAVDPLQFYRLRFPFAWSWP